MRPPPKSGGHKRMAAFGGDWYNPCLPPEFRVL